MTRPDVLDYLRANHERTLSELVDFATIPSVSTDPAHVPDIQAAAPWVASALANAGPIAVRTIATTTLLIAALWATEVSLGAVIGRSQPIRPMVRRKANAEVLCLTVIVMSPQGN